MVICISNKGSEKHPEGHIAPTNAIGDIFGVFFGDQNGDNGNNHGSFTLPGNQKT